jgi:hypothetical protein
MKKTMKATSLRSFLTVLLVIMIGLAGVGFYFGLQQVRALSVDVSHTAADANASGAAIDEFQKLKQALAERETLVNKANQLFTTEQNYQSQALKDVQKYASAAGLTVSNTNFDAPAETEGSSTLPGKTFVITIQSPASYKKLIQFLNAIEGNLPKMQVASIEISRPNPNDADNVTIGEVRIAISTR